jgi:hypothetical protein
LMGRCNGTNCLFSLRALSQDSAMLLKVLGSGPPKSGRRPAGSFVTASIKLAATSLGPTG